MSTLIPDDAFIVRATRFELLDRQGHVRAALGINPAPTMENEDLENVGLEIFDEHGSARAWLLDFAEEGVQLCLSPNGNQTVVIETAEPGGEVLAGSRITLSDLSGATALSLRVSDNGRPSAEPPSLFPRPNE